MKRQFHQLSLSKNIYKLSSNHNKLVQIVVVESVPQFLPHRHASVTQDFADSWVGIVSCDGAAPLVAKGRVFGVNTQAVRRRLVPHAICPRSAEIHIIKQPLN
jgi:hypothetical protein